MKQKELSIWLKFLVVLSGAMGFVLMFWLAPTYGRMLAMTNPRLAHTFWPSLAFVWGAGIPIYLMLYEGWKIFTNIGEDQSFSQDNVDRLKKISILAIIEIILYLAATIVLLVYGITNIAVYIVIFMILFVSIFIAMSGATLSHLVNKALELKKENDLTI